MTEDDPLLPDDRAAFAALPLELQPPADLEERVVQRLRVAGVVRPARRRQWVLGVAAALALFATGVVLGRVWPAPARPSAGDQYLLLLYGADTATPEAEAARVSEYAAWARDEAAAGRLLSGEKLSTDTLVLGGDGAPAINAQPLGFFIIRAATRAQAEATANRCPHLRYGGTIILKPIVATGT